LEAVDFHSIYDVEHQGQEGPESETAIEGIIVVELVFEGN